MINGKLWSRAWINFYWPALYQLPVSFWRNTESTYWWSLIFSVAVLLLIYCHFSTSTEALENTFFRISALKCIQSAMKLFLKNCLENWIMPTKSLFYALEKNTCLVMLKCIPVKIQYLYPEQKCYTEIYDITVYLAF